MLNIYKLKKKENVPKIKNESVDFSGIVKNTIPANKEWFNSIYTFNSNSLKLLPIADNVIINLIRSYFNMFYNKIDNTKSRRMDIIARIKSARKIWVSRPEIKHTNDKLTITLYIYNRQYNYLIKKLYKLKHIWHLKKRKKDLTYKYFLSENSSKLLLIFKQLNSVLIKILLKDKLKNVYFKNPWYFKYVKKIFTKEIAHLKLKQIMLFNKLKFNTYIIGVRRIMQRLYKKNVEFNLVSLKNYYLSNNILSQIIRNKLKKRKNKAYKILKASLRNIKTPILNERTVKRITNKILKAPNLIIRDYKKDFLYSNKTLKWFNKEQLEDIVLKKTKYKLVSGIMLKVSGRITRRIIAERAIYKIRSVGTLKNVNSSYKGLSSVMVRGYKKSNLESTCLKSKTHVGAFGLKGWMSSY